MVLALVAPAAGAAPYSASEWIDYGKPRPTAPSRGEPALDAASGGQSYRAIVDDKAGKGPVIVRLDIAADGRATLNTAAPTGKTSRNMPNDRLEAFLAALDASRFKTTAAQGPAPTCTDGPEIVFEALVDDRYRLVVECGDELGLMKAVDLLRAG